MTLKEARKRVGMTQEELSEKTGIHTMQISKLERGVSKISKLYLFSAIALSDALGIDPHELLKMEE